MQIAREQGELLALLARLQNARRIFEIGVFTGYSSLNFALVLKELHGDRGHLLALDVSDEYTRQARNYWQEAGVTGLIELQVAPALESLAGVLAEGRAGTYDLGFVDADKASYGSYYERGLELLRPGGVLVFDNVLWSGRVLDSTDQTPDTRALRTLVTAARADERVEPLLLTVGDGLLVCRKR
jgi:predicted O-methyltransferase YrrM